LPDLVNSPNALLEYSDPLQSYRHRCTMGSLVASRKSSTSSTDSPSTTLDSDKSKTKRSLAGRDQWDKLAVQHCARGRELNLGSKLRDGQTCRNQFDKLIAKHKPTGSTEVPHIVLRLCESRRLLKSTCFVEPLSIIPRQRCNRRG
jgi:hypothetical protein